MTNEEYSKTNRIFIELCKVFNIKGTARQAGKFRRNTGFVYKKAFLNDNCNLPDSAKQIKI